MPTKTPYPKQRPAVRRAPSAATVYDAVVIGGGPAGMSAAIYLARYNRRVVVIDSGEGRSTSYEKNENYLGFPAGIAARELRARGCRQMARFGAKLVDGCVTSVARNADGFLVRCGRQNLRGRTLILATGVVDTFPKIDGVERYVGRSLFWCITCDGWKARGKRVLVVGDDDEAATTALQFLNFTKRVTVLTNSSGRPTISAKKRRQLEAAGIALIKDQVGEVQGRRGMMHAIQTRGGKQVAVDMMFSMQGSEPNVELARTLGVKLVGGYIKADFEQRTSVKHVYAAGDVTKAFAHQIVTAAHEGATAAQAANYDLYRPEQREA